MKEAKVVNLKNDRDLLVDRDFHIFGTIQLESIRDILEDLIKIDHMDKAHIRQLNNHHPEPVRIHIHSCGGNVLDGWALVSQLMAMDATPIHTFAYGSVMSMALPLLLCGDPGHKYGGEFCDFMYHNSFAVIHGSPNQLDNELININRHQEMYNDFIFERVEEIDVELFQEYSDKNKDLHFYISEALQWGVVDRLLSGESLEDISKMIDEVETEMEELETNVENTEVQRGE